MTTYVDRVLEPSETVRYRTTVSWIVYVPSLLLAFMAAMFLLAAGSNPAGEVIAALGALAAATKTVCYRASGPLAFFQASMPP
jgi:hypothetical protein